MNTYTVKSPAELSEIEIKNILEAWEIDEWKGMEPAAFKKRFDKSEFHLLTDPDKKMLSVARINFKFKVKINEVVYPIAELVGFVAIVILQGYGKSLLVQISENLKSRNIEAIGFCRKRTSKFYETTGFKLFYDKVQFLREWKDDQWFIPAEDDDIINLTLADSSIELFEKLDDKTQAYLIFE